ncbi:hypothetical protein FGIG_12212 [Fasciola gigantica]|uniref:Uncharacterized protein n=1 Tax=Fasciola gigantica TaxID=46835 RepID=A0A504Z9M4_FASGI|nr:hypothetical protein FGIG_12212 [Fasciola gigantica]
MGFILTTDFVFLFARTRTNGIFRTYRILAQDSTVLTKKLLKLGALSSLLYALGNLEFPDSQRQASLTVEYLCQTYPLIDQVVREAMGPSMHEEFTKNPESHYLQLTPLQADVLVSNKVSYLGGKWY